MTVPPCPWAPLCDPQWLAPRFGRIASGYGRATLRFLPFAADRLVYRLRPAPGEKVLDIGTGTGTAALALARVVQRGGRVTGVDVAEGMIDEAEREARTRGLANADWHVMDARQLEFRSAYFHAAASTATLFYLPDMAGALAEWRRVLRPGGRLGLTAFAAGAFQPMGSLLMARLAREGLAPGEATPFPWCRLGSAAECARLLEAAGYVDARAEEVQLGFHLASAGEWWDVVWHTELRGLLEALAPEAQGRLRVEHLEEVQALAGEEGVWMDVTTILAVGRRPG